MIVKAITNFFYLYKYMVKTTKSFKLSGHPAKHPALKMGSFKLIGSATNPKLLAYDYWAILLLCSIGAAVMLISISSSI